jgi:hypothetical protein
VSSRGAQPSSLSCRGRTPSIRGESPLPCAAIRTSSREAGVPEELDGCHIATIGGYVVGGHVPVEAIRRLLAERPPLRAITLPGMPLGSPGMTGSKQGPFTVYAIARDGGASVFMTL